METRKTLCTLTVGGRANWYAIDPTLAKISNGPRYLTANLNTFPILNRFSWDLALYTYAHLPGTL